MSGETENSIELHASTEPSSPPSTHAGSSIFSTTSSLAPEEPPLMKEEIDVKPWKYIGYRGYVDFIASENDFYIMRRFAALNVRAALALQDEVVVLEDRLEKLEKEYCRRDAENEHNGSLRKDREERRELMLQIVEALTKYSLFTPLLNLFTPESRERISLSNLRVLQMHSCYSKQNSKNFLRQQDQISKVCETGTSTTAAKISRTARSI
tara:strand:+ start:1125 stop:1754 length:630 start_codon:yes stop_codon:yes gene_type:complete